MTVDRRPICTLLFKRSARPARRTRVRPRAWRKRRRSVVRRQREITTMPLWNNRSRERARRGLPLRIGADAAVGPCEVALPRHTRVAHQLPLEPRHGGHTKGAPVVLVIRAAMADGRM